MNKIKCIMAGVALLLTASSMAATITVNAPTTDGWLVVYDPSSGGKGTFVSEQFTGGTYSFEPEDVGMGNFDPYRIEVTYDAAKSWQSRVHWDAGISDEYSRTSTYFAADPALTVNVVAGAIDAGSRKIEFLPDGSRRLSVTYRAATGGAVTLADMNDNNELDANIRVYKPATAATVSSTDLVKNWNPDSLLGSDFTYTVGTDSGYDQIIIANAVTGFNAAYVGVDDGAGGYNLRYNASDDPGDSAYWSSDDAGELGVTDVGSGGIAFSAISDDVSSYQDMTPYYVVMDKVTSFDNFNGAKYGYDDYPDNYMIGLDSGFSLTDYQYYAIPEPSVMILLLGSGSVLFVSRRIFMI